LNNHIKHYYHIIIMLSERQKVLHPPTHTHTHPKNVNYEHILDMLLCMTVENKIAIIISA